MFFIFSTLAFSGIGFLVLLLKSKLRQVDVAIFISSTLFALIASITPIMGRRVFFAVAIPISLGVTYFIKGRNVREVKFIFLALLVLFTFIPLTQSFDDNEIMYQTKNEYQCAKFSLMYKNWSEPNSIFSHFRFMRYLRTIVASPYSSFGHDMASDFPENLLDYEQVIYTIGLEKRLLPHNYTIEQLYGEKAYNQIFDSGESTIATEI